MSESQPPANTFGIEIKAPNQV
jgi:hypothetical protein